MPFCFKRWKIAHHRWRVHLQCQLEEKLDRDHEMEPEELFEIPEPQEMEFRTCPACGSEFILNRVQAKLHPDPKDPWVVCEACDSKLKEARSRD